MYMYLQEAEVGGAKVPEPFDVRTETAEEAGSLSVEPATKPSHKKSPKKSPIHMKSPIHKPETSHDCKYMTSFFMPCIQYMIYKCIYRYTSRLHRYM